MSDFTIYDAEDVRDLIAEYPLAWIAAPHCLPAGLVQMPLLGEYDDRCALKSLFGHVARSHPLCSALVESGTATILFSGPNAYISPSQAGVRAWGPTWNFAHLAITADLTFLPEETGDSVAALVGAMERDRPDPWDISALGERYASMERAIVGFRAHVTHIAGRFKLGQDERPEVRDAIIRSLGDQPLARWMERFANRAAP